MNWFIRGRYILNRLKIMKSKYGTYITISFFISGFKRVLVEGFLFDG